MRKLFIVCSLLLIFSPPFSWGQNSVFLAQNSAGLNNGLSCANAKAAASYFNNSGNWSGTPSGIQIGPDTTVNLCGAHSLSSGTSDYLQFQGSGTSGHPIILQCAVGATISAPYWSGDIINLEGKNFLTLDGTNCVLSASDNGTTQTNHQNGACGICSAADVSNVNIVHWTINNLYIHACTGAGSTETTPCPTINDAQGDNNNAIQIWGGSNDTIAYNTITNVHWGVVVYYGGSATNSTGIQVHHNSVSNMDHGAILGDQGANSTITSSNCSSAYHDNDFSNTQNWDDNGNNFHHDGIHAWANNTPGSHYSGVCFYNNYFHGGWGWHPSGLLTSESLGNINYYFNNLIGNLSGNTYCADGLMTHFTGTGSNGTNQVFVNNTIDPGSTPCSTGVASDDNSGADFGNTQATGTISKNNLFMSNHQTYVHSSSGSIGSSDFNIYGTPQGANPFYGTCGGGVNFATWKSGCGFDTHGLNVAVSVNGDYTLPNGSKAISAGVNLTSLGITALDTGAPQTFGVTGSCGTGCVPRSSTGAWDVGAYPFSNIAMPVLFGFTENNTSPGNFPTVTYKMQRFWDSPPLQWPSINTSAGVFNFTNLDTMLAQDFSNGVLLGMYTLARTPPWATSQPTDTTCNYQLPAVGGGHGECYPPSDINADGSGTDAIWKAWITAIATHANDPAYLTNHAHIKYWEIWNEPDNKPFWAGTFAQLSRMTEDANCIITGHGLIHPNGNGTSVNCAATAIDPTGVIVMSSGHAATANAIKYAQNQLYCNNISGIPSYELPCPIPAGNTAAALDIINFHMKPGVTSSDVEGNFATYVASINGILQFPETTKPLWDGETAYDSAGFTSPYNDPDMAASLMPRMYLTMLTNNITGSAWYTWDQIASQNAKVAISYQQTYNYLNGSTLSPICTVSGTVWTCGLINGATIYLILWDTSQVCSGGVCPTGPVSVPTQWGFYQDMTSVSTPTPIVSNSVPVGIKPVILTVGSGAPQPYAPTGLMDIIQ